MEDEEGKAEKGRKGEGGRDGEQRGAKEKAKALRMMVVVMMR